jgi:hypothetical protein
MTSLRIALSPSFAQLELEVQELQECQSSIWTYTTERDLKLWFPAAIDFPSSHGGIFPVARHRNELWWSPRVSSSNATYDVESTWFIFWSTQNSTIHAAEKGLRLKLGSPTAIHFPSSLSRADSFHCTMHCPKLQSIDHCPKRKKVKCVLLWQNQEPRC